MTNFEIKIALVGNSASGKKTVVNALLRDNYGDAGLSKRNNTEVVCYRASFVGKSTSENYCIPELKLCSDESIKIGEHEIKEKVYDIDAEKSFVETRSDTQFSFIVVPGGDAKYESYITEKWDTFDAVIMVFDGKKGFKEDEENFLKLLKENREKHSLPLIVVCNKIDDVEDEKLSKHVKKAQSKVEKILGINTSIPTFIPVSAIQAYVYRAGAQLTVYQFEDFDKDMMELVGKEHLGSKNWKKMTAEDRFRKTHAIISDAENYQEAMKDCGFERLLKSLEHFLGGDQTQQEIIQKQIDRSLEKLSPFQSEWISYTLFSVYQKQNKLLDGSKEPDPAIVEGVELKKVFWKTFDAYKEGSMKKFEAAFPKNVSVVADVLQELMYYQKLVALAKWDGEEDLIVAAMKGVVRQYIRFLFKRQHETNGNASFKLKSGISPIDWSVIWQSLLLMSYDKRFCEMFGREKIMCEGLAQEASNWKSNGFAGFDENCPHCSEKLDKTKKKPIFPRCKPCGVIFLDAPPTETLMCIYCAHDKIGETHQCENCKYKHEDFPELERWLEISYNDEGEAVPSNPANYGKIVHLDIPEALSDPNHFGHPAYKFCNFVATLEEEKSKPKEETEKNDE